MSATAEQDLAAIARWLVEVASEDVASRFVDRISERVMSFQYGGERGTIRDDATGLRIIGIMPSVSIAFTVDENTVAVQRILYRGQSYGDETED